MQRYAAWTDDMQKIPPGEVAENFTAVYLAAEVDARIAELEKALKKHGNHSGDCKVWISGECYCGWTELKRSLMERESQ